MENIEKASSVYEENQNEQFIKISFTGTGKDGTEPATGLHIHASHINFLHKIQAAIHLFEHLCEQTKNNDDSMTDLITHCLQSRYKYLLEKAEGIDDEKNN